MRLSLKCTAARFNEINVNVSQSVHTKGTHAQRGWWCESANIQKSMNGCARRMSSSYQSSSSFSRCKSRRRVEVIHPSKSRARIRQSRSAFASSHRRSVRRRHPSFVSYAFKFSNFKPRTSSGVHPPLALRRVGPPIFLRNETKRNEIKYPPSVSAFGFRFPSSRAASRTCVRVHRPRIIRSVKRTRQSSISSSHSSSASSSSSSSSSRLGGFFVSRFLLHSSGIFSHRATRVSPSSSPSVSRVAPASRRGCPCARVRLCGTRLFVGLKCTCTRVHVHFVCVNSIVGSVTFVLTDHNSLITEGLGFCLCEIARANDEESNRHSLDRRMIHDDD